MNLFLIDMLKANLQLLHRLRQALAEAEAQEEAGLAPSQIEELRTIYGKVLALLKTRVNRDDPDDAVEAGEALLDLAERWHGKRVEHSANMLQFEALSGGLSDEERAEIRKQLLAEGETVGRLQSRLASALDPKRQIKIVQA